MAHEIRALTGVRFLLAAMVLAFHGAHFLDSGGATAASWAYNIVHTGYIGVQFFFVLSGFILTYTYRDLSAAGDRRAFWIARFARVYPVYVLGLLAVAPFIVYWTFFSANPAADAASFVQTGFTQLLLLQAWTPAAALTWNTPGWSLSVEAFFYLLFPYLLAALSRMTTRELVACGLAAFASSQVVAYALDLSQLDGANAVAATDPPPWGFWVTCLASLPLLRLPEFVIGIVAGIVFLRHPEMIRPYAGAITMLSLAACALILAVASPFIPLLHIFLAGLGLPAAGLFVGLAATGGSLSRLLASGLVVRLGAASYAMYILHYPIALWLTKAAAPYRARIDAFPITEFVVYFVIVVLVSLCVYARIEEPMRRAIRAKTGALQQSAARPRIADDEEATA